MNKLKKITVISMITLMSGVLAACNSKQVEEKVIEGNPYEVLSNKDARQAMHLALNRDELSKYFNGTSISEGILNRNIFFDINGKDYRDFADNVSFMHDLKQAQNKWRRVKEDLGFTDVTVNLDVTSSGETKEDELGELYKVIEKQLEQLDGLDIKLTFSPSDVSPLNSESQLVLVIADVAAPIADGALDSFRGDIGFMSVFNYKNETLAKTLDNANNSTTIEEKWKYCFDAERNIVEDAIAYPLYQNERSRLKREYVKGNELFSTGVYASYRNAYLTNNRKEINVGRNIPGGVELDPSKVATITQADLIYETMDGLVKMTEDNKIEPVIAQSWEVSEDSKIWTFHLVEDATWHNGDPVTAHDFEYALKRALNPEKQHQLSGVLMGIKGAVAYSTGEEKDSSALGIKAIDDHTLRIELEKPIPEFLNFVALPMFYPQNKEFVEMHGDKYATSVDTVLFNGPFKLETIDEQHLNYTLVKNDKYKKAKDIKLEKINVVYDEPEEILEMYKSGKVDIIINGSYECFVQYWETDDFKLNTIKDSTDSNASVMILFNPNGNPEEAKEQTETKTTQTEE